MKKSNKTKKIIGAVVAGVLCSSYFLLLLLFIVYCQFIAKDKIPFAPFIIITVFLSIPFIGIVISLIGRIKEINSGEEEDASIY